MKRKPKSDAVRVPRKWDRGLYAAAYRDGYAAGLADRIREHAAGAILGQLAGRLGELMPGAPPGMVETMVAASSDRLGDEIARAMVDGDPEIVAVVETIGTRGIQVTAPPRKPGRLAGPFRVVDPSSSSPTADELSAFVQRAADDPDAPELDGTGIPPAPDCCPGCGRSTVWVRPPGDRLDYCAECGLASGVSDGRRIMFHGRPRRSIAELDAIRQRLGLPAPSSSTPPLDESGNPFATSWIRGKPAIQECPLCAWKSDTPYLNRWGVCPKCVRGVFFIPRYPSDNSTYRGGVEAPPADPPAGASPTPGEAAIAATGGKLAPSAARALDELADGRSSTAAADGAIAAAARSDAEFAAQHPSFRAYMESDGYRRRIARAAGLRSLEREIDECRCKREARLSGCEPPEPFIPTEIAGSMTERDYLRGYRAGWFTGRSAKPCTGGKAARDAFRRGVKLGATLRAGQRAAARALNRPRKGGKP